MKFMSLIPNYLTKSLKLLLSTRRTQTFRTNYLSKNGAIYAVDTDTTLLNVDKNNKIIRINHKNTENQITLILWKHKKKKFTKQKIHSNISSKKPLPDNYNTCRLQLPYKSNYRGRTPIQRNSQNFSQNRYSRSNNHYRNNYSRSNSNRSNYSNFVRNSFIQVVEKDANQIIDPRTPHTIGIENNHLIKSHSIKITNHETIQPIDQLS